MSQLIDLRNYNEDGERAGWKDASEILAEAYGDKQIPSSNGAWIRKQTIDERGYRYRPIGIMFSCSQRYSNRDFKRGTKASKPKDSYNRDNFLSAKKVREKYEEVLEEALAEERRREESRAHAKKVADKKQNLRTELQTTFADMTFKYTTTPFNSNYSDSETLEEVPVKLKVTSSGVDMNIDDLTADESRQLVEFIKAMRS